jgi:hypothetical protein
MVEWKRTFLTSKLKELYELVIPSDDRLNLPLLLSDTFRVYAVGSNALVVLKYFEELKTVYIETFTLHPRIRGKHLSVPYWYSLKKLLEAEWSIETYCIEAYLKNQPFFMKYFGWKESSITEHRFCPTPTVWLFSNLTHDKEIVENYHKWCEENAVYFACY